MSTSRSVRTFNFKLKDNIHKALWSFIRSSTHSLTPGTVQCVARVHLDMWTGGVGHRTSDPVSTWISSDSCELDAQCRGFNKSWTQDFSLRLAVKPSAEFATNMWLRSETTSGDKTLKNTEISRKKRRWGQLRHRWLSNKLSRDVLHDDAWNNFSIR